MTVLNLFVTIQIDSQFALKKLLDHLRPKLSPHLPTKTINSWMLLPYASLDILSRSLVLLTTHLKKKRRASLHVATRCMAGELFHACGHVPSPWDRYRACLGEKSTSLNEGVDFFGIFMYVPLTVRVKSYFSAAVIARIAFLKAPKGLT